MVKNNGRINKHAFYGKQRIKQLLDTSPNKQATADSIIKELSFIDEYEVPKDWYISSKNIKTMYDNLLPLQNKYSM